MGRPNLNGPPPPLFGLESSTGHGEGTAVGHCHPTMGPGAVRRGSPGRDELGWRHMKQLDEAPTEEYKTKPQQTDKSSSILNKAPTEAYSINPKNIRLSPNRLDNSKY